MNGIASVTRARPLLGTVVSIRAAAGAVVGLASAVEAAFAAVATVQRLMSVHAADSDVARLNAAVPGEPVAVHRWTAEVLAMAIAIGRATGFLFDCACGVPFAARGRPDEAGTLADLALLADGSAVARRRVSLDLGGIAKGFAVDRAIEALVAAGVAEGSVNAGGDLRLYGPEPQRLHVRDPLRPSRLYEIGRFDAVALATSAGYHATPLYEPGSGARRTQRDSVSVLAPTCMVADALTKPVALSARTDHPWLAGFGARAVILQGCGGPACP